MIINFRCLASKISHIISKNSLLISEKKITCNDFGDDDVSINADNGSRKDEGPGPAQPKERSKWQKQADPLRAKTYQVTVVAKAVHEFIMIIPFPFFVCAFLCGQV